MERLIEKTGKSGDESKGYRQSGNVAGLVTG